MISKTSDFAFVVHFALINYNAYHLPGFKVIYNDLMRIKTNLKRFEAPIRNAICITSFLNPAKIFIAKSRLNELQ